ncbi:MAG: transglycosylase SLT domain-containing protein [Chitinophagales bacterium]
MFPTVTEKKVLLDFRAASMIVMMVILTNGFTYALFNKNAAAGSIAGASPVVSEQLYLLDQASVFVSDVDKFEQKVREVANQLSVPPEWLMAVMYSESKFDASVSNHRGSGATGLIQWMPTTAKDFDITVEKLRNLNHTEQLDYVYDYLDRVRRKYKQYETLTELYLAILYPRAIPEDYCYTMYAKPSEAYKLNVGLDIDKDGRVTVKDIDDRMKKMYPTAYMAERQTGTVWSFLGF